MKLKPVGHRILIQLDRLEEISEGGIVLMRTDKGVREQASMDIGTVIELGPQAYQGFGDGVPWCQPGDRVKVVKFSGVNDQQMFQETGIMYCILNDDDVLAKVEEESQ